MNGRIQQHDEPPVTAWQREDLAAFRADGEGCATHRQAARRHRVSGQRGSLITLFALLSIGGWPTTFPHFRVALTLDAQLASAVVRHAVEEAAGLWAPYGVAVLQPDQKALSSESTDRSVDATLTVRIAESEPDVARAWSSPFGSIRFLPDGEPERLILVHYNAITRGLSTVSLAGARESQWPGAVRDRVLGRMIGRVLAHEIGHWLLKSRNHSTAGLMRAHQTTDELAGAGRAGFGLTAADFARLKTLLLR